MFMFLPPRVWTRGRDPLPRKPPRRPHPQEIHGRASACPGRRRPPVRGSARVCGAPRALSADASCAPLLRVEIQMRRTRSARCGAGKEVEVGVS